MGDMDELNDSIGDPEEIKDFIGDFEREQFEEIKGRTDGSIQSTKDILASKQAAAEANTPEGMELAGWALDGWLVQYTLLDGNAYPVYAFPRKERKPYVQEK